LLTVADELYVFICLHSVAFFTEETMKDDGPKAQLFAGHYRFSSPAVWSVVFHVLCILRRPCVRPWFNLLVALNSFATTTLLRRWLAIER